MQHRHVCATTTPPGGWTKPSEKVQEYIDVLSEDRRNALRDRAVLTVSIPIPMPQIDSHRWQWMSEPPLTGTADLTWVIDGSRRYAADWTMSTTGCCVAGIDKDDKLVAYARATPAAWVKTVS